MKYFILMGFLLLSTSVFAKETYDPYAIPGSNRYQQGDLGSRQKSMVGNMQKKYPDGYALPGPYSYKKGTLEAWQKKTRPEIIKLMGLNSNEIDNPKARALRYEIVPFTVNTKDKKNPLSKLLEPLSKSELKKLEKNSKKSDKDCKTENSRGRPLYADYYPPKFEQKKDHIVLYSCKADSEGIRVYKVSYQGYQNKKVFAYLFIPNQSRGNFYNKAGGKAPTLIYYHGHGSTKDDASFNKHSYVRGIAYHAALNGFVTLVPDVRGFGESEIGEGHKAMAKRLRSEGTNFVSANVMDTVYAQDLLQQFDYSKVGFNYAIDTKFNAVGGVSMGGLIALYAGALDTRFELISSHGIFVGNEVLFSKFHCHCSKIPALEGKVNIFDIALLIAPRTLHVGMGAKDQFFNTYSKSALEMHAFNLVETEQKICFGQNDKEGLGFLRNMHVYNSFQAGLRCPLVLEISKDAEHEVIGYGYQFHLFWLDYLNQP